MKLNLKQCHNRLLAAANPEEKQRLELVLEPVTLRRGQVLCEQGRRLQHVYFPTSALVSLACVMQNGESSDVALAGADGLIGPSFCGSGEITQLRAQVQRPGEALRVPASALTAEFGRGAVLQMLALHYQLLLVAQIAQTALCNRYHLLEQQLCRWMLMSLDLCSDDVLHMTQQQIATMLGVRREGVSAAARRLQSAGLIVWRRGRVRVLDREGLEHNACECYRSLAQTRRRLFPEAATS